jgi:hypothetical protein
MLAGAEDMLLNTSLYAITPLALLLAGNLAWAVVYLMVFRNIRRHGAVEIPAAAVASNLAWVTVWGLCYRSDLGSVFVWANRAAVVLELSMFSFVLFKGARHVRIPEVRRWFKPGLVASYVCWFIMLYFFVQQKYDAPNGIISGFVVALFMSALYVLVELSDIDASQYSLLVGWGKLVGNSCGALFSLLMYPANHFLLTICAITLVLDGVYLLLFKQRKALDPRGRAIA